ncbi:MAG: divalent-cation tolerance protein CutA [Leptolyngbyaceae cyanobacterium]
MVNGQPQRSELGMADYGVILVTVNSQETAHAIAEALVHDQLAACVNLFPVQSIYTWKGAVQKDSEWQLVIKTRLAQFASLEAKLTEIHPYEVPEIIALPIVQGSSAYLQWLGGQVGSRGE